MPVTGSCTTQEGRKGIIMHHRNRSTPWSHLAVLLFVLCACAPPTRYQNSSHPSYGAPEFSADLTQCRNSSATMVVSTLGYTVQSRVGVDEGKVNACMAVQGWQQAPPSVAG
jgi:hypothetical protein